MAELKLSDEQAQLLRQILESYLSDLRMEIADTDSYDFRQRLKRREVFLKDVIGRLAA